MNGIVCNSFIADYLWIFDCEQHFHYNECMEKIVIFDHLMP